MWRLGGLLISLILSGCATNTPYHQYSAPISNSVFTAAEPPFAPSTSSTITTTAVVATAPAPTGVGGPYVAPTTSMRERAENSERPKLATYTPEYVANLSKCISPYPYGCRHSDLSADDLLKVRTAEYHRNLTTCLGSYSYNCKTELLNTDDAEKVRAARYKTTLNTCLSEYSASCRSSDLTAQDQETVRQTQYQFNLARCLRQPSYRCNKDSLNDDDKKRVASLEVSAPQPAPSVPTISRGGGCAENGSCYGDVSALTGNPKTTHVSGYYRRDGTYVRGHYRSGGRR